MPRKLGVTEDRQKKYAFSKCPSILCFIKLCSESPVCHLSEVTLGELRVGQGFKSNHPTHDFGRLPNCSVNGFCYDERIVVKVNNRKLSIYF